MPYFVKRPIVIEARQFSGEPDPELETWLGDWFESWVPQKSQLIIRTRESNTFAARATDWIIRGIVGEFYACGDEIFVATYEAVEPPSAGG